MTIEVSAPSAVASPAECIKKGRCYGGHGTASGCGAHTSRPARSALPAHSPSGGRRALQARMPREGHRPARRAWAWTDHMLHDMKPEHLAERLEAIDRLGSLKKGYRSRRRGTVGRLLARARMAILISLEPFRQDGLDPCHRPGISFALRSRPCSALQVPQRMDMLGRAR